MLRFKQFLILSENVVERLKKQHTLNTLNIDSELNKHARSLRAAANADSSMLSHLRTEYNNDPKHDEASWNPNHEMINKLAEGDPAKDKKHLPQIVDWYKKGHFRAEDLPSVHDTLSHFQDIKNKQ